MTHLETGRAAVQEFRMIKTEGMQAPEFRRQVLVRGPIPKRVETLGEYLIKKLGLKAPDGRFHGTAHLQR